MLGLPVRMHWMTAVFWSSLLTKFQPFTNVQGTSVASQMLEILSLLNTIPDVKSIQKL